jgi:Sec23/Sec24 beta-sandwich domain/Sec23/Sec24 helical domain/Sec23/Sec24 trunk domain
MTTAVDTEDPDVPVPVAHWLQSGADAAERATAALHTAARVAHCSRLSPYAATGSLLTAIAAALSATSSSSSSSSSNSSSSTSSSERVAGGRVLLFTGSRPTAGLGKLRNRSAVRLYGTDHEWHMYAPAGVADDAGTDDDTTAGAFYLDLAHHCAQRGVAVDIFAAGRGTGDFLDAATLGIVARVTGGRLRVYAGPLGRSTVLPAVGTTVGTAVGTTVKGESAATAAAAVVAAAAGGAARGVCKDVEICIKQTAGHSATLKVRCSTGLVCAGFTGPGLASILEAKLELATVSTNSTVGCTLEHDGQAFPNDRVAFLQIALLYTARDGRRLVRVHNLALPLLHSPRHIYKLLDVDALFTLQLRALADSAVLNPIEVVQSEALENCVSMLAAYRSLVGGTGASPGLSPTGEAQLMLPESMKLLPLYTSCLLKSRAFHSNPAIESSSGLVTVQSADERAALLLRLSTATPLEVLGHLYPRVYRLKDMQAQYGAAAVATPCTTPTSSSSVSTTAGSGSEQQQQQQQQRGSRWDRADVRSSVTSSCSDASSAAPEDDAQEALQPFQQKRPGVSPIRCPSPPPPPHLQQQQEPLSPCAAAALKLPLPLPFLPPTMESLQCEDVCVVDAFEALYIYVPEEADASIMNDLFAVRAATAAAGNSSNGSTKPTLRLLQTGARATALRRALGALLSGRSLNPEILLVSDNEACVIGSDRLYLHMVEDRTSACDDDNYNDANSESEGGVSAEEASYQEFLCSVHAMLQSRTSSRVFG